MESRILYNRFTRWIQFVYVDNEKRFWNLSYSFINLSPVCFTVCSQCETNYNNFFIINLSRVLRRAKLRWSGEGAQRPVWRVNEPKKTCVRTAQWVRAVHGRARAAKTHWLQITSALVFIFPPQLQLYEIHDWNEHWKTHKEVAGDKLWGTVLKVHKHEFF